MARVKRNHAMGEVLEDAVGAAAIAWELDKAVLEAARKTVHGAQILAAHLRAHNTRISHYPPNDRYATRAGAETEYRETRVPDYHRTEALDSAPLALPAGRGVDGDE